MTRVANLSAQNLSLSLLQQTQSRVMDAQVQISTGKKAERYMGVAPDSARLLSPIHSGGLLGLRCGSDDAFER